MSIRPRHTCNILNLIKLWEIRKKFPKDYVGWVYIYVTKALPLLLKNKDSGKIFINKLKAVEKDDLDRFPHIQKFNGKVVARFWCDKVEHIEYETCSRDISGWWKDNGEMFNHKDACLTYEEMFDYIGSGECHAIHITKLEIFDKSKEISEFYKLGFEKEYNQAVFCLKNNVRWKTEPDYVIEDYQLTRAPQSWCYVEV